MDDVERAVRELLTEHQDWLADNTFVDQIDGDWVEITTPFLDTSNDAVQLYARLIGEDKILLTDDGHTLKDLKMRGVDTSTEKRRSLIKGILSGFAVTMVGDRLEVEIPLARFPMMKANLIQAVLALGDLFYLSSPYLESLFFEDVRRWLDDHGVRYSEQVTMIGKTGYYHVFDFLIPRSDVASERLVQTISRLDKQAVEHTVFSWSDVQPSRPDAQAFAVVNDETAPTTHSEGALSAFGVRTILWSDREVEAHLLSG
ncbi:MAG: DUF1828 domain-containing protein [Acidimicrobiia bacterium]|nr:DUF1828 domain-containing protein [Acidimicrobiia bacterium]